MLRTINIYFVKNMLNSMFLCVLCDFVGNFYFITISQNHIITFGLTHVHVLIYFKK